MVGRVAVILTLLVGFADGAMAQASDQAKAEDLIRQANELRRRGENAPAFRLYQQAYELSRNPRTAAQLGLSELSLGYWVAAQEHLNEALTSVGFHPWIHDNRATLEAQLATTAAHIAEIVVEGKPDGAEVFLNRKRVGTLPLPEAIKVAEGRIDVELRAKDHESAARTLTVAGKTRERVVLSLRPNTPPETATATTTPPSPSPSPASPSPVSDERAGWRSALPWAALGLGAVALGLGAWQHVAWRQAVTDFDAIPACGADDPNYGSDHRCQGLFDDLDGHRTRTFIAYGAAGALAGAAVALFLFDGRSSDGTSAPAVGFTPGGFIASWRARFR
jgi:hypothetical protein